ncbi:hypothetical protein V6N13_082443 [Hibiscus sabdariffa]
MILAEWASSFANQLSEPLGGMAHQVDGNCRDGHSHMVYSTDDDESIYDSQWEDMEDADMPTWARRNMHRQGHFPRQGVTVLNGLKVVATNAEGMRPLFQYALPEMRDMLRGVLVASMVDANGV